MVLAAKALNTYGQLLCTGTRPCSGFGKQLPIHESASQIGYRQANCTSGRKYSQQLYPENRGNASVAEKILSVDCFAQHRIVGCNVQSDHGSYQVIDRAFAGFIHSHAQIRRLAGGFEWTEGPVWFADSGCLLFSDIPANRIWRWCETSEVGQRHSASRINLFRYPSGFANGHTRDRQGRLITCEHGGRRVIRTEYDGKTTVLADSYQGKRLNSPNDVVVKSDGSIWFTDPHYGIISDYEGHRAVEELSCNVYRIDPSSGQIDAVATDFDCPNGIAFSPDEKLIYISETGRADDPEPDCHIRVFEVEQERNLKSGRVFHKVDAGVADGLRLDTDGNIWTSAGDGVHCVASDGRLLGKIPSARGCFQSLLWRSRPAATLYNLNHIGLYSKGEPRWSSTPLKLRGIDP